MPTNYIPTRDNDFDAWLNTFQSILTSSPAVYKQITGTAELVAEAFDNWHAAYEAANAPVTRSPVTIAAKDEKRILAEQLVRPIAVSISLHQDISPGDKVAIGVNPRTTIPAPVTEPTTFPVLSIESINTGIMDIRYRDVGAPAASRAKPANVTQIQLFAVSSATVVSNPATIPLTGVFTKVLMRQNWLPSEAGKTAYITARWQTRRGLVGPYAPILAVTIV